MQSTFGHKWLSLVPDDATQTLAIHEWRHQLAELSEAQMESGFRRMLKRSGANAAWPPGAAEFRALCKPHREPYERVEFQGHALPHKPLTPAENRERAPSLRAALRGEYPRGES
ncbi:hypothetical protein [Salinisphaera sp. T31B1]|uniref:hypothetical protein n=1 Tax=Salinisphaera sp. T31B1 TaxID=727963 RepID=UPI003340EAC6